VRKNLDLIILPGGHEGTREFASFCRDVLELGEEQVCVMGVLQEMFMLAGLLLQLQEQPKWRAPTLWDGASKCSRVH
jgi:hypothetical protein